MRETTAPTVQHVDRLDLGVDATVWPFAIENRIKIDALFAELRRAQPALFNGHVLLLQSRPETVWSAKDASAPVKPPEDNPLKHVMSIFGGRK